MTSFNNQTIYTFKFESVDLIEVACSPSSWSANNTEWEYISVLAFPCLAFLTINKDDARQTLDVATSGFTARVSISDDMIG